MQLFCNLVRLIGNEKIFLRWLNEKIPFLNFVGKSVFVSAYTREKRNH